MKLLSFFSGINFLILRYLKVKKFIFLMVDGLERNVFKKVWVVYFVF